MNHKQEYEEREHQRELQKIKEKKGIIKWATIVFFLLILVIPLNFSSTSPIK